MATHVPSLTKQALDVEGHLQRSRAIVRAIMMFASEITHDTRDALMLVELTNAIDIEFAAIDKLMGIASSGAES